MRHRHDVLFADPRAQAPLQRARRRGICGVLAEARAGAVGGNVIEGKAAAAAGILDFLVNTDSVGEGPARSRG